MRAERTGLFLAFCAAGSALAGCGDSTAMGTADLAQTNDLSLPPDLAVMPARLKRASRSSAIAISDDDRIVAAVSPDDDRVYLIDTANANYKATVQLAAGAEPRSVAFAPDGRFWVANRGNGTIVAISDITKMTPALGAPIPVGAEPTGIAVTPTGARVAVANYADGTVSIVDAAGAKVLQSVSVGRNPRALTISNAGSGSDDAETIYVTLMFGQPVGGVPSEGNDVGRQGAVVPIVVGSGMAGAALLLAPIADTTFTVLNKATNAKVKVGAYPNQLQSIALVNGKLFVPSAAASPAGPVNFAGNVHPFVSVYDLTAKNELPFGTSGMNAATLCGTAVSNQVGYAAGTLDLAVQTRDLNGMTVPPPVLFPTLPVDIAFVAGGASTSIGYVVSMASDEILRVAWDFTTNTACAGAANAKVINLQAQKGDIKVPIGMVIRNDGTLGYVNAWAGREVEVVDFSNQTVKERIALSAQAAVEPDLTIQKGKKFFWTSTGRWSANGWGSCGSCHPDGLSDNVTFVFNTGPRQTLPLDSDYAKKMDGTPDATDQRILNWSAIFDEIHDFENNTRGVSGGLGAVVSITGKQIDLVKSRDNNLNGSVRALAADPITPREVIDPNNAMPPPEMVDIAVGAGWNAIDRYVQSLRSLRHAANLDATSVKNGKMLFELGACANCHAGPKWTLSRRSYTPVQGGLTGGPTCSMQTTPLAKKSVPVMGNFPQNTDKFQLQTEKTLTVCTVAADCATIAGSSCVGGFCSIVPQRLTCALRNVNTFGAGPQGISFEVRTDTTAGGTSLVAQGATGFNVPSLLSLAATAPYFHHGAAQTLPDLLTKGAFGNHLSAGNPNFAVDMAQAADLAHFLLSIDSSTTTYPVDPTLDLCTGSFVANNSVCTNP